MSAATVDTFLSGRFYIQIDSVIKAVFAEISGLQVETEVFEYREGGNNGFVHQLPGSVRVGNLVLKRGVVGTSELFRWYMQVAQGKIERRNLSVIIYNAAGEEMLHWSFLRAYPVRWVGPILSAESSAMAVETVELAHDGMQLE